jgi:hypothetical protein
LVIDPFVKSHAVNENDNNMMDQVVTTWANIAHVTGCSIHLVHHTRKANGEQATIESSRGASAVKDAARVRRAVNGMTKHQAEDGGISEADRPKYICTDYTSSSLVPAGE